MVNRKTRARNLNFETTDAFARRVRETAAKLDMSASEFMRRAVDGELQREAARNETTVQLVTRSKQMREARIARRRAARRGR